MEVGVDATVCPEIGSLRALSWGGGWYWLQGGVTWESVACSGLCGAFRDREIMEEVGEEGDGGWIGGCHRDERMKRMEESWQNQLAVGTRRGAGQDALVAAACPQKKQVQGTRGFGSGMS